MNEHPLDPIFHPRSVAIVGLSSSPTARRNGFLAGLLDQGFPRERIYPVNPRAEAIEGLPCYPSLRACPDPVDHVISIIPRTSALDLLAQCVDKRVRSVHFFTAGFSESGDEAMATVERTMVATARSAGVRILGPNCMGLYVPGAHLAFGGGMPREAGQVFVLSQSGVNASAMIGGLADRGVRLSKCVSFGNGADIAAAELFDYACADDQSTVVVAYLEGVRDGRGLFDAIRECARLKPTLVLKGGLTPPGARAAASHTGSLAGSAAVFTALCRQVGALQAETLEELVDDTVAITTAVRRVQGPRSILLGIGGGFSVLSADAIASQGLELPELPGATQEALAEYLPVSGNSVRNPIDATFPQGPRQRALDAALLLAAEAPGFDVLFAAADGPDSRPPPADSENVSVSDASTTAPDQNQGTPLSLPGAPGPSQQLVSAEHFGDVQARSGRPLIAIRRTRDQNLRTGFVTEAYRRGVATFPSIPRAAHTVASLLQWRARREGLPELF